MFTQRPSYRILMVHNERDQFMAACMAEYVVRTDSGERDMERLAGKSVAAIPRRSQILHDAGGGGKNGNI